ncbi:MAG TPA: hypothetical protein PLS12_08720 [Bacteroidales bacterium]|nr:hypothetical protein [Bacteroidales bacterium]
MRKITIVSILSLLALIQVSYAQDTIKPVSASVKPFVPVGKIGTTVYSGFQTQTVGTEITQTGFILDRAYLGYTYNPTESLSGEVKIDVGSPSDISDNDIELKRRFMYVRNAYGKYKINNTSILFGIINSNQYKLQETTWGYRYVYKSFMDQHKFANSADIGISIEHTIADYLSVDASVCNGEGYTKLQSDMDFIYQLGAVFKPNKIVTFRLTGDYSNLQYKPVTIGSFLSIQPIEKLTLSAEYNIKLNYEGKEEKNLTGSSIYANYNINEQFKVFARRDDLQSNTLDGQQNPWNYSKNGVAYIGGIEYSPNKYLRIAANYQNWIFEDTSKETKQAFGILTELKF